MAETADAQTLPVDAAAAQGQQPAAAGDAVGEHASDATTAAATAAGTHALQPDGSLADAERKKVVHELSLRDERISALVGLELPFYSASIERVLETVGGMANLQQTHEAKSQFLPVKLRPTEPSCKPLFADMTKTQTILLRVRRRKKQTRSTQSEALAVADTNGEREQQDGGVDAEIVGLVREKYVCEGMADFQYFTSRTFYPSSDDPAPAALAVPAAVENLQPRSEAAEPVAIDSSICKSSAAQSAWKANLRPYLRVQSESELEMIPEVFSKVDLPLKYEFRQRSGYQPTETAKKTLSTMTYLNFHDDVAAPAEPKPENPIVRRRPVGANDAADDHVLRVLQEKLAQKPIWLRPRLFVGLDFLERRAARRLLRKLCYVFVDGPWRGSWIRMGYDPRKSADSAKYQVIELRNNRELVHAKVTHPSRKRTKKFSGINPKGPRIVKVTQTSENENAQASKRRRKERFLLSETRRAFLADSDAREQQQASLSDGGDGRDRNGGGDGGGGGGGDDVNNEWDSENDPDAMEDGNDAASVTSSVTSNARGVDEDGASVHSSSAAAAAPTGSAVKSGERTYEIFGVPLTSANVLFQLDEIDDDEVRAWTAQFAALETPTLLGGWFSTHMFLPLREIIRFRIAALVGRSKADLDTRRKRIEVLKKQALAEYTEQAANGGKDGAKKKKKSGDDEAGNAMEVAPLPEDIEQAAFEESLALEHAANGRVPSASSSGVVTASETDAADAVSAAAVPAVVKAEGAEEEDDDDDDLEFDEEDEIQEEEEEAAALARQERLQSGGANDSGDDSEDGAGDESADDEMDGGVPLSSKAAAADVSRAKSAAASAPLVSAEGAAATPSSSGEAEPQVAMEYSF